MTGTDRARIAQLPNTAGMKSRVIMQRGHDCNFGAQVSQMIRLAGAVPELVGTADRCTVPELQAVLSHDHNVGAAALASRGLRRAAAE